VSDNFRDGQLPASRLFRNVSGMGPISCKNSCTSQIRSYLKLDFLHDAKTSMGHASKNTTFPCSKKCQALIYFIFNFNFNAVAGLHMQHEKVTRF